MVSSNPKLDDLLSIFRILVPQTYIKNVTLAKAANKNSSAGGAPRNVRHQRSPPRNVRSQAFWLLFVVVVAALAEKTKTGFAGNKFKKIII